MRNVFLSFINILDNFIRRFSNNSIFFIFVIFKKAVLKTNDVFGTAFFILERMVKKHDY